ncbi:MAG: hypothetical protein A2945_02880 [Candidatus Liptonbacteria bacterium RIFCSPLOWO2_01_FULL_52_25]|uniref:Uncharacterized protein n=1 Tax=Candidatus Liptonbacteria bacterium RIFCSPLOWO2_01_FULL_52_25 TaxID=1798650 RepID=A0A1G2CDW6_9BACT|nr:MAG: hypothetical protein A2945_02880 [Candidatus Liptonbacteria bacterium RIFCSPLOWO2_01_FULL_52_25]
MSISLESKLHIAKREDVADLFFITCTEEEALKQWIEEHKKMCRYFSATTDNPSHPKWCIASSPLTYSFRPNTVLTTCTVTCLCGESKDITAYENA